MKLAITAKGPELDSQVDPRFGRAQYIIVVDEDSLDFEAVDNSANANAFKGAGIQAATMISEKGAQILLTGYCGPKAFQVLEAAEIKVASDVSGTVREAIMAHKSGTLPYTDSANAEAHW